MRVKADNSVDLLKLAENLFSLAQQHTPKTDYAGTVELLHLAKALKQFGGNALLVSRLVAQDADHSTDVIKQSTEYRQLKAKFTAALSTIADLGARDVKQPKTQFHAGINEGLRRAAKVAIIFLADFTESAPKTMAQSNASKTSPFKPGSRLTRQPAR
jgi:hypothetical protein